MLPKRLCHDSPQTLVNKWDDQERQRQNKEQLKASLYSSRSQLHGSGVTDDELEERDFRRHFPEFNKVLSQNCLYLFPLLEHHLVFYLS